jgi:hypothetical protein
MHVFPAAIRKAKAKATALVGQCAEHQQHRTLIPDLPLCASLLIKSSKNIGYLFPSRGYVPANRATLKSGAGTTYASISTQFFLQRGAGTTYVSVRVASFQHSALV